MVVPRRKWLRMQGMFDKYDVNGPLKVISFDVKLSLVASSYMCAIGSVLTEANISAILQSLNLPADDIIAAARSDATGGVYAKNIAGALSAGVIGSPCYVIDGEVFWGQDRLDMVGEMLASGRGAYRA